MSEVNRYKVVKMLSEDGNHIGYTPHGPEIVLASSYDELIAENEKLKADLREAKDAKLGLSWAIGEIKAENEKLLARDKMHIEHFNALSDFKQRTVDAFDAKIYTLNEEIEALRKENIALHEALELEGGQA